MREAHGMSCSDKIAMTLNELERVRRRITDQLAEVERQLGGTTKKSPKRLPLLMSQGALLSQLQEQKRQIMEAKRVKLTASRDHEVTDHALVRWLERKRGVDVQALKDQVLTDGLRAALVVGQDCWSDGSMTYVLRDGMVVTIYETFGVGEEVA